MRPFVKIKCKRSKISEGKMTILHALFTQGWQKFAKESGDAFI